MSEAQEWLERVAEHAGLVLDIWKTSVGWWATLDETDSGEAILDAGDAQASADAAEQALVTQARRLAAAVTAADGEDGHAD